MKYGKANMDVKFGLTDQENQETKKKPFNYSWVLEELVWKWCISRCIEEPTISKDSQNHTVDTRWLQSFCFSVVDHH